MTHVGSCFCGAVTLEVSGSPEAMGYSSAVLPLVVRRAGERLQPLEAGGSAGHIGGRARRHLPKDGDDPAQYCSKCGGHLMANHPTLGLVDVFAATSRPRLRPRRPRQPRGAVPPMRDGLPKLKDFPAEFGGSGETVAE